MRRSLVVLLASVVLPLVACSGNETYPGHGIVQEVSLDERQVLVAHDDIPGVMPAMTMSFPVYDDALLRSLAAGDEIDFELSIRGGGYWIASATVVGHVETGEGWARLGDTLVRADPAPAFALIDQAGEPRSLADLAGKIVLLDFIFTRCPGPCPILTSNHVSAQRALDPGVRARTHFVSISLDPQRDTPADLRAYAEARGADLESWSFLTGPEDAVAEVVRAYAVGTTRSSSGEIEHVVASFLIDAHGRIVKRYLGLEHEPEAIAADIAAAVAG